MELEFDKEIDAILRKVRAPSTVRAIDPDGSHLDTDGIVAFAENVLPDQAKHQYIEHFADCDRCRRILSGTIQMSLDAQPTYEPALATAPPVGGAAIPWYQNIFRSPNLALAMGALVVVFSGVLGYIAIQNRNSGDNATVAKVNERAANAPFLSQANTAMNSNSSSNAMAAANVSTANTAAPLVSEPESAASSQSGRPTMPGGPSVTTEKDAAIGGTASESAKPVAAPAATVADQPSTAPADKKEEDSKAKTEIEDRRRETAALSKTSNDQVSRDVLSAAKRSGPNAKSVQNTQQQIDNNGVAGMVALERKAGGKKFVSRDGAWYDTAYHGQPTINVARGSAEYKKLDGGLRKIGDSISGIVVVAWKSKAYRIQ